MLIYKISTQPKLPKHSSVYGFFDIRFISGTLTLLSLFIDYYITFNYMPCNIPPALLNNRLAISISGPIINITVGPGPISVIGPAFLQFDWLTLNA